MQRAGKKNIVSDLMKIKLQMKGTVNGKPFVVNGDGNGCPNEGTQLLTLIVQGNEPLPFAFDILSAAFQYGNRAFTEYPQDIPDYFKQSFEFGEGFSWERTFTFEDGAICVATNDITKVGDEFRYEIRFDGVKFPEDGPVMKKETVKWEPSTEIMYMEGGALKGEVNMALLLNDGSHYRCDFKTTYKAKNPVPRLPPYHYVDHCIEIVEQNMNRVKLQEHAKAHSGLTSASQPK